MHIYWYIILLSNAKMHKNSKYSVKICTFKELKLL